MLYDNVYATGNEHLTQNPKTSTQDPTPKLPKIRVPIKNNYLATSKGLLYGDKVRDGQGNFFCFLHGGFLNVSSVFSASTVSCKKPATFKISTSTLVFTRNSSAFDGSGLS